MPAITVVKGDDVERSVLERFWWKYVARAGSRGATDPVVEAFAATLPRTLVTLLTVARVERVSAPDLSVVAVGDWLAHAHERHVVMLALAEALDNPRLADMVPVGDTTHGFEVALDRATGRIVWLDSSRYDCGDGAIVSVVANDVAQWIESLNAAGDLAKPTGRT